VIGQNYRTSGNGFKLKEGRFRLEIRKKFFAMSMMKHWHRLPREVVDAPSLEVFKVRLDRALSNLVCWKVSLPRAGGLELDNLLRSFQRKPVYGSTITEQQALTGASLLQGKAEGPELIQPGEG